MKWTRISDQLPPPDKAVHIIVNNRIHPSEVKLVSSSLQLKWRCTTTGIVGTFVASVPTHWMPADPAGFVLPTIPTSLKKEFEIASKLQTI